jgi:hypothetical protein
VRNSASLPIVSKRERSKALFVSRFSPEVTAADVEVFKGAIKPQKVSLHQTKKLNLMLTHHFIFW